MPTPYELLVMEVRGFHNNRGSCIPLGFPTELIDKILLLKIPHLLGARKYREIKLELSLQFPPRWPDPIGLEGTIYATMDGKALMV